MRRNLVTLSVFVAVTAILVGLIGLTLGRVRLGDSTTYYAVFTDASGLRSGVDVRAAGVPVGSVGGVELTDDHQVRVEFTAPGDLVLSDQVQARVRWANLTGDRYLELTDLPGAPGRLAAGGTIPASRTQPALDLDTLFAGFKPLIQALDPDDVNQLTSNLIAVTQGQGGSMEALLSHVGSLTTTLADRDELIGDVITHFGGALGTVADRDAEFDALIDQLGEVMHSLAEDKDVIGTSITELDRLTAETAELLEQIRPDVSGVLTQTRRLALNLDEHQDVLNRNLELAPQVIRTLSRVGAYGTFTNFYLCSVRVVTTGPTGDVYTPWIDSEAARCQD